MMGEHDRKHIEQLLEVLVCPVTKDRLTLNAETEELVSVKAGLAYPIRDGIPVLLAEQARRTEKPE